MENYFFVEKDKVKFSETNNIEICERGQSYVAGNCREETYLLLLQGSN